MRALVHLGPGAVELQERPAPRVGADDVVVKVVDTGICGTDRKILLGRPSRPEFVCVYPGPPAVPEGWLLQSWTYLVADAVHCSLTGAEGRYLLRATAPGDRGLRPRLDLLLARWAATLTAPTAQPDRPLGGLDILASAGP
ncbi:hypothetical protein OG936_00710 [Streptomyces sp. NBC_00846]|uniref:hypothetical protein n=1 Tax=Streptomyces sp. NBC_00846 TaxID=2975849 RepID=UPI003870E0AA|nr:hypothetical protein OG936_00710 [Streptomyces sp. NBC_00846]